MTRTALDDAYANAAHIAGSAAFPARWAAEAAAFRADAHAELDIPYASDPGAGLDLFFPAGRPLGLMVFVHGGYWHSFGKSDWSHFASGAVGAGYAAAVLGYPLAPAIRVGQITRLVSQAVAVAAARVPGPVHLTGHSAGGHLVARLLLPDAAPPCADRITRCVPISPLGDLRPLLPQTLNDTLRLTEDEALQESPALHVPSVAAQVTVHVGAAERPSFLWQADRLARVWDVPCQHAPGRHHFDVIEDLRRPGSDLLRAVLG
ncbi:MAG: alpha/beta hydrolase fold domain-containing protein [Pseudomonadota bacterium]